MSTILNSSSDDDSHVENTPRVNASSLISNDILNLQCIQNNVDYIEISDRIITPEKIDNVLDVTPGLNVVTTDNNLVGVKGKKRRRKNKTHASGLPPEIANDKTLLKYWYKRFSLFSLFDLGIKLDKGKSKKNV